MVFVKRIVGFCGIICSECPVFIATRKNNDRERERIALMFSKQYEKRYGKEDIRCAGCTTGSSLVFNYCETCEIRKCGKERKLRNCAFCPDYPCPRLSELFSKCGKARTVLDDIARSFKEPRYTLVR